MKLSNTQHASSSSLRSTLTTAVLFIATTLLSCANAEEVSMEDQDVLQAALTRNQNSINQQLSSQREKMILDSVSLVSTMLEHEAKQKMYQIELANKEYHLQQEELREAVRFYLRPTGVISDPVTDLVDNTISVH